jgi:hypothetical protein
MFASFVREHMDIGTYQTFEKEPVGLINDSALLLSKCRKQ